VTQPRRDYRTCPAGRRSFTARHEQCGSIGVSTEGHAIPISSGLPANRSITESFAARFAARPAPTVEASRPAHQPRPVTETLDAGQCRIWLNECRREIDRLRMGLDVRPERAPVDGAKAPVSPYLGFDAPCGEQRESLSDPPKEPKLYAVEPLSAMPDRRHPGPVEQPPRIHVLNHYHVTNLGTLLDVLA
jgi:hypothetical protein